MVVRSNGGTFSFLLAGLGQVYYACCSAQTAHKIVLVGPADNRSYVFSVRPKFGFGIGNRYQGPISVSVSEPIFFFTETETFFFQIFLIFSHFFGEYEFLQASK